MSFIYITHNPRTGKYNTRVRDDDESYRKDLELVQKYGDEVIRTYEARSGVASDIIGICHSFARKEIDLDDLDNRVQELLR